MSSKKNSDTIAELSGPYEPNDIGLKGILGFAVGLFLLIVITFGLMWAFLNLMEDYSKEFAGPPNPVLMSEKERLPPEPRLQLAPGFGVESEAGRVNLELLPPQAEYWELKKQWDEVWENGRKDKTSGVYTVLPIEDAKEKLLQRNIKARSGDEDLKVVEESNAIVTDASSGRLAADRRQ